MKPMPGTVVDPEIIIQTPNLPPATVYTNTHNWDGGNRCLTMGPEVARLPLPPDLWIASTNGSNPGESLASQSSAGGELSFSADLFHVLHLQVALEMAITWPLSCSKIVGLYGKTCL
jgi:hypothetical protein